MLNVLIAETGNISPNSTIAHVRNSIELYNQLNRVDGISCDLFHITTVPESPVKYDIVLFSYASAGADFSRVEELLNHPYNKGCKVGWITNEFELFANGFVKDRMTFMITNFEEHGIKKAHRHDQLLTTNLNTLIYRGRNPVIDKKYDMVYYGTYRKYREAYFQKYFKGGMIFSTTKKNWKKFIDLDIDCQITDKLSWVDGRETLNLFKSSLYIEDTKTHNCFNYMANRFYEAVQCNTALFFDKSCINTINKDRYPVDDYFD